MFRRLSLPLAAAGLLMLASQPLLAADAAKEIATAGAHAGMAAASSDLKMIHAHMQHVLNCLQGPGGADYDANQLNPCKDQGMGAIPDSQGHAKMQLEAAVPLAKAGLAEPDVAKAKEHAAATQAAIGKAGM